MFLQASVILLKGEGVSSHTHPGSGHPPSPTHPLEQMPRDQTHPLGADTPQEQIPGGIYPPGVDTHPPGADTPPLLSVL